MLWAIAYANKYLADNHNIKMSRDNQKTEQQPKVQQQRPRDSEKERTPIQTPGTDTQRDEPPIQKAVPIGDIIDQLEPPPFEGRDRVNEETLQAPSTIPAIGAAGNVIHFNMPRDVDHPRPVPPKRDVQFGTTDSCLAYMMTMKRQ